MSGPNSKFDGRAFGFAGFMAATAFTGAAASAGIDGVQRAAAGTAYSSSRSAVAGRLRRMRAEARETAVDLSLARLESALRLRYIKRMEAGEVPVRRG